MDCVTSVAATHWPPSILPALADGAEPMGRPAAGIGYHTREAGTISQDLSRSPMHYAPFIFGVPLLLALCAPATWGQVIDYTHGHSLRGVPGVSRGVVQYHVQANGYGRDKLLQTIAKSPPESHLLIDWEPWLERLGPEHPWYGDAGEDENLKMMSKYAWLIREITPALKDRKITIGIYSVPSLMQRNWSNVSRPADEKEPQYQAWLANQEKLLKQAERSGLLDALRECGGHVQVVGYLPDAWDGSRPWHAHAISRAIDNQSTVLDKHKVPYRWLFRISHPDLMQVMADRAKGRADWWEDRDVPDEAAKLRRIVRLTFERE